MILVAEEVCSIRLNCSSHMLSFDSHTNYAAANYDENSSAVVVANDNHNHNKQPSYEIELFHEEVNIAKTIAQNEEAIRNQQFYKDMFVDAVSYGMWASTITYSAFTLYHCPVLTGSALSLWLMTEMLPYSMMSKECGNFVGVISKIMLSVCMGNAQFALIGEKGTLAIGMFYIFSKPLNELMINEAAIAPDRIIESNPSNKGLDLFAKSNSMNLTLQTLQHDADKFPSYGHDLIKRSAKLGFKFMDFERSFDQSLGADLVRDIFINRAEYFTGDFQNLNSRIEKLIQKNFIKHVICLTAFPNYISSPYDAVGMKLCRDSIQNFNIEEVIADFNSYCRLPLSNFFASLGAPVNSNKQETLKLEASD